MHGSSEQALPGVELFAQDDAVGGDVELAQGLNVVAATGFHHGDGPFQFGVAAQELQQQDVVGQMGDAVSRRAG